MISLYAAEEPKLQVLEEARSWAAAGLIDRAQLQAIERACAPRLVRVNLFLRLLLAGFALLGAGALVGLVALVFGFREMGLALCLVLVGAGLAVLADRWLIEDKRLYRCGAEEALLLAAASFAAGAAGLLALQHSPSTLQLWSSAVFLAGASTATVRYGNPLPALAAVFSLAALPAQFVTRLAAAGGLQGATSASVLAARGASALLMGILAVWSHRLLERDRADCTPLLPGYRQCLETVRWASLGLLYLASNSYVDRVFSLYGVPSEVHVSFGAARTWVCAALTAGLPAASLWLGVRRRDRALLWFGGVSALASVLTLKYFFHLGYLAEELTAAGAAVAVAAFLLLRWLRAGSNRERGGFTAERLLDPKLYGFDLEALAAVQPLAPTQVSSGSGFQPGGGAFGGGGASGGYG